MTHPRCAARAATAGDDTDCPESRHAGLDEDLQQAGVRSRVEAQPDGARVSLRGCVPLLLRGRLPRSRCSKAALAALWAALRRTIRSGLTSGHRGRSLRTDRSLIGHRRHVATLMNGRVGSAGCCGYCVRRVAPLRVRSVRLPQRRRGASRRTAPISPRWPTAAAPRFEVGRNTS